MIKRSRGRVTARLAGEFSSPSSAFCADSFRCPFHTRGAIPAILAKVQVTGYSLPHNHSPYMASNKVTLELVHGYNYGVHRTCAETAAVSRGTSDVTTKQRCNDTNSVDIQDVLCKATVMHSESYA